MPELDLSDDVVVPLEERYNDALLMNKKLRIVYMTGDGNCLFRAAALQVYGDVGMHAEVRKACCDHMVRFRARFEQFISDDDGFDAYISKTRQDNKWGDEPEIRAMEELYDAPAEIYNVDETLSTVPKNLDFGGGLAGLEPLRFSYHGENHYNCVVPKDYKLGGEALLPRALDNDKLILASREQAGQPAARAQPSTVRKDSSDVTEIVRTHNRNIVEPKDRASLPSLPFRALALPAALLASYLFLTTERMEPPLEVVAYWLSRGNITEAQSQRYTKAIEKHGNLRGVLEQEIPTPLPDLDNQIPVGNQTYSNNTEAMHALRNVTGTNIRQQTEAEQRLAKTGKGIGGTTEAREEQTGDEFKTARDREIADAAQSSFLGTAAMTAIVTVPMLGFIGTGLAARQSMRLQSALRELNRSEDKTHGMDRKTGEQEPEATR